MFKYYFEKQESGDWICYLGEYNISGDLKIEPKDWEEQILSQFVKEHDRRYFIAVDIEIKGYHGFNKPNAFVFAELVKEEGIAQQPKFTLVTDEWTRLVDDLSSFVISLPTELKLEQAYPDGGEEPDDE